MDPTGLRQGIQYERAGRFWDRDRVVGRRGTLAVGATGEDSAAKGVGGTQADNSAQSAGAAYVFIRTGTTWSQQAYVKASNAEGGDIFGASVALSSTGDTLADAFGSFLAISTDAGTLATSAPYEASAATGVDGDQANNAAMSSGAVYVFR